MGLKGFARMKKFVYICEVSKVNPNHKIREGYTKSLSKFGAA